MSVQNFIPTLWSSTLLKERDRVNVAVSLCNKSWEGEIKNAGDRVKINTIGDVTIGDYAKNSTSISFEELKDASTMLEITESKYFAFKIDDVDKAQTNIKLMQEGMRKAAVGLSNSADTFIYNKYTEAANTVTQGSLTSANVISAISDALKVLQQNNVPEGMEKFLEVGPQTYQKMLLAKIIRDYGNSDILTNGYVGNFMGFKIYVTNGVITSGTTEHCIARTRDAIAFAEQIKDTEAIRLESAFADGVRGLHLYGAKVLRNKELVHLNMTMAAESSI